MKCAFCGYEFSENDAAASCKGCSMTKGCKLLKCPRCGYETPPEPKWLKKLLKRSETNGTNR